jgi:hypothetical protein
MVVNFQIYVDPLIIITAPPTFADIACVQGGHPFQAIFGTTTREEGLVRVKF